MQITIIICTYIHIYIYAFVCASSAMFIFLLTDRHVWIVDYVVHFWCWESQAMQCMNQKGASQFSVAFSVILRCNAFHKCDLGDSNLGKNVESSWHPLTGILGKQSRNEGLNQTRVAFREADPSSQNHFMLDRSWGPFLESRHFIVVFVCVCCKPFVNKSHVTKCHRHIFSFGRSIGTFSALDISIGVP